MTRIEDTIISNLFSSEKYCRVVVPFLKTEYFSDSYERHIIEEFTKFFENHNHRATPEIIGIELRSKHGISEKELTKAEETLKLISREVASHDWLVDKTEAFCKQRAVYLGIVSALGIIDGTDTKKSPDSIPKILQDALSVSFDVKVGHNYIEDAQARYEYYTTKEDSIPFDLEEFNKVTKGGLKRKALTAVAAQSGGGKSIFLTHTAASTLKQGKNVLYITLEMSEERIAERIDANLMNVDVDSLKGMSKDEFMTKIEKISAKTHGKLFIKEYPTGGAHSGHFRALIDELKTKQNFAPDLICVDYLGICASSRMKMGGTINTYSFQKSVAEELRSIAIENNVPVVTGVQINRSGFNNSDIGMENTADSIGIAQSLDFYFALVATAELAEMDQVMVQVMKNRYGETNKFIVGLTKRRMTFYNTEQSSQTSSVPKTPNFVKEKPKSVKDVPLFDRSNNNRSLNTGDFKF
jgi:replicative DNA helicase